MRRILAAAAGLGLVVASALAQEPKAGPAPGGASELKDQKQKASYSIGLIIGKQVKPQAEDFDMDVFMKGLRDGMAGTKPLLTEAQIQETMQVFQREAQTKQLARQKAEAAKSKAEGEAYLAANKAKLGVTTTRSGLQYKVLKPGTGASPAATSQVTVNYKGTLVDGTVFDSSYDRGQPATFPVNGVIPGWTEALQLMKVGAKYELTIPSALAYGSTPPPGSPIPPDSVLLFEVELLNVR